MIKDYLINIRKHIPYVGKLADERDLLLKERNKLLYELGRSKQERKEQRPSDVMNDLKKRKSVKILKRDKLLMDVSLGKIKIKNKFYINNIKKYLNGKHNIFDIGSGPKGSYWWNYVDKESRIVGIDTNFFPKKVPKNVRLYKYDASKLFNVVKGMNIPRYKKRIDQEFSNETVKWGNVFDMVVANHVLEHVISPDNIIKGINKLLIKGGVVYVGIPDSRNFLDVFYHLLFPDGGGHISFVTNEIIYKYFIDNGFKLISCNIWPNMWSWLKDSYLIKKNDMYFLTQEDFNYLSEVFEKELTIKKGYFYGWEMVFKKE